MRRQVTYRNKYRITASLLGSAHGTLLDVGARDRVLMKWIDRDRIAYYSADVGGGCDFRVDLERPLTMADGQFDFVIALDVLEHVENLQGAFLELARITRRQLIVGLPNLASWPNRLSFLLRGRLPTAKYDLTARHPGDRHRWLTVYSQIGPAVEALATAAGFGVTTAVEEAEGVGVLRLAGCALATIDVGRTGLWTGRCVYVLHRERPAAPAAGHSGVGP